MSEKILTTTKYDQFELHEFNRDVKNIDRLAGSMKRYGFLSGYPIFTTRNGGGKLKVVDGHHRLAAAKRLGIPIKYVIDDDVPLTDIIPTNNPWTIKDFLISYVRQGRAAYIKVKEYVDRTGISLTPAISMLAGESAGSNNQGRNFRAGLFRLGDPTHAEKVADIVLWCKKCKAKVSTDTLFIKALSRISWVEQFDHEVLKKKIRAHKSLIEKQPNIQAYQSMIEEIYNRQSKSKIPLAFLADEKARERSAV